MKTVSGETVSASVVTGDLIDGAVLQPSRYFDTLPNEYGGKVSFSSRGLMARRSRTGMKHGRFLLNMATASVISHASLLCCHCSETLLYPDKPQSLTVCIVTTSTLAESGLIGSRSVTSS